MNDDDCDDDPPCWCGVEHPYYEPADTLMGCGGLGFIDCRCGGDLCVCHNHGEVECDGWDDAERSGDDDGDDLWGGDHLALED